MKNLMEIKNGKYVAGKLTSIKITKAGLFKNENGEEIKYQNAIKLIITFPYKKEVEIAGEKIEEEVFLDEIVRAKFLDEIDLIKQYKKILSLKGKRILAPFSFQKFEDLAELS